MRITTAPGSARQSMPDPVVSTRPSITAVPKSSRVEETPENKNFRMKSENATVCYQCDAPFTVLNRRRHCVACGQIFCGKCTRRTESARLRLPKASSKQIVRVCDYCFDRLSIDKQTASSLQPGTPSNAMKSPHGSRNANSIGRASGLSLLDKSHLDLDESDEEESADGGGEDEEEELLSKTYQRVSLLNLKSLMSSSMTDLEEATNSGFGPSNTLRTSTSSKEGNSSPRSGEISPQSPFASTDALATPAKKNNNNNTTSRRKSAHFGPELDLSSGEVATDSEGAFQSAQKYPSRSSTSPEQAKKKETDRRTAKEAASKDNTSKQISDDADSSDSDSTSSSEEEFQDMGMQQVQEDTFDRWFSKPMISTAEDDVDDPLRKAGDTSSTSSGLRHSISTTNSASQSAVSLITSAASLIIPSSSTNSPSTPSRSTQRASIATTGHSRNNSQTRDGTMSSSSSSTGGSNLSVGTGNQNHPSSGSSLTSSGSSHPSIDALRRQQPHRTKSRPHFAVDSSIALPTTPEVKQVRVVSHSLLSAFGDRSQDSLVSPHESAFRALSIGHLEYICDTLIDKFKLEKRWKTKMIEFADAAVVSLKLFVKQGDAMDILQYIKIKTIPGGSYDECSYFEGLIFDGDRVKRTMQSSIPNARILLLGCSLEYERREGVLLSIEKLLQQEKEYLTLLVAKITTTINPSIIFVERNVSIIAQQMFADRGVCVLQNVKPRTLQILSRLSGAAILANTDHASISSLGKCASFEISNYAGPWGSKACAMVSGPRQKFGTVLLRGAPKPILQLVKQSIQFLIFAAYNMVLENHVLYEQTSTTMCDVSFILRSKSSYLANMVQNGSLPLESDYSYGGALSGANKDGKKKSTSSYGDESNSDQSDPLQNTSYVEKRLFSGDGSAEEDKNSPNSSASASLASKSSCPSSMNGSAKSANLISTSWSVAVPREKVSKTMSARDTVYNVCPSISLPPLHAELKQTCEVRLDNGTYEVPVPPGPTLNFNYRSLLVPNEHLCADPEVPVLPPPGKNMRPSYAAQQINHLRKKRIHAFKQFAPQHLIYLHSLYSPAGNMQCLPYTPQIIHFYSSNDMTLGQFLEDFCFNDKSRCRNEECHRPTSEHERCILHADGRINIAVRPFDINSVFKGGVSPASASSKSQTTSSTSSQPHPLQSSDSAHEGDRKASGSMGTNNAKNAKSAESGFDASEILMWANCKNLQRQAPYMVPMSRTTWNFSLGKFFELIFYAAHTRCRTCNEPTYRGHVRYFYYKNKVVMFEYEQVKTFDTAIPPMQVALDTQFAQKLMHKEIDDVVKLSLAMYEAVLAKILDLEDASTKLDDEEELRSITIMHRSLEEEKVQFLELVEKERNAVRNVPGTSVFQVSRLRRLYYWNIRRWNDSVSAEEGRVQKKWKAFVVTIKEKEKVEAKEKEKFEKELAAKRASMGLRDHDRPSSLNASKEIGISGSDPQSPYPFVPTGVPSFTSATGGSLRLSGDQNVRYASPGSAKTARSTISGGAYDGISPRSSQSVSSRSRSSSIDEQSIGERNSNPPGSFSANDKSGRSVSVGNSNHRGRSLSNGSATLPHPSPSLLSPPAPNSAKALLSSSNHASKTGNTSPTSKLPSIDEHHQDRGTPPQHTYITGARDSNYSDQESKGSPRASQSNEEISPRRNSDAQRIPGSSSRSNVAEDVKNMVIVRPQGSSSQEVLFDLIGSPPPSALLVVPQLNFTTHDLLKEKGATGSVPTAASRDTSVARDSSLPTVEDVDSEQEELHANDNSDIEASPRDSVSHDPLKTNIENSSISRPVSAPLPVGHASSTTSTDTHPLGVIIGTPVGSSSLTRDASLPISLNQPQSHPNSSAHGSIPQNQSLGHNYHLSSSPGNRLSGTGSNNMNPLVHPGSSASESTHSRFRDALHIVLPQKKTQIIDVMATVEVHIFPPHSAQEPVVPVYENEPSSVMAFALMSDLYREKMLSFEFVPPYFVNSSNSHQISTNSTQSNSSSSHPTSAQSPLSSAPSSSSHNTVPSYGPITPSSNTTNGAGATNVSGNSSNASSSASVSVAALSDPYKVHSLVAQPHGTLSEPAHAVASGTAKISEPIPSPTTHTSLGSVDHHEAIEEANNSGYSNMKLSSHVPMSVDAEKSENETLFSQPLPIASISMEASPQDHQEQYSSGLSAASLHSSTSSPIPISSQSPSPSMPPSSSSLSSIQGSSLTEALTNALAHEQHPSASKATQQNSGQNSTAQGSAPTSQNTPSTSSSSSNATNNQTQTPVGPKSISLDANARFDMNPSAEAAHRGLISPEPTHIDLEWKSTPIWGGPKVHMQCKTYFARQFAWLRNLIGLDERDFAQSLSRCKPWKARGGKSNSRFARTLDERFILKQVQAIELEGFLTFAPIYFDYFSKVYFQQVPTAICKIVGIFSVTLNRKGKSPVKVDLIVQENLFYGHSISKVFDLKGSLRSRYARPESPDDKDVVYQDENLLEMMYGEPICVSNEAKAMLAMTVWNDTLCLSSLNVMDYSLLVGVDEENGKLVLGIIDYMRTYTWDKQLETYVKRTGILGAGSSKSKIPTIISPKQYKKRFRVAIWAYFLLIPNLNTKLIYDFMSNASQSPKISSAITKK